MALGKAVDRRTAEMIARVLQTSITQMDQTGVLNDPSALFATLSCAFEKLVNDIEEKSSETQETDQKLHPENWVIVTCGNRPKVVQVVDVDGEDIDWD
jgi:hypothetical protein